MHISSVSVQEVTEPEHGAPCATVGNGRRFCGAGLFEHQLVGYLKLYMSSFRDSERFKSHIWAQIVINYSKRQHQEIQSTKEANSLWPDYLLEE